jgi:hypothetical protein
MWLIGLNVCIIITNMRIYYFNPRYPARWYWLVAAVASVPGIAEGLIRHDWLGTGVYGLDLAVFLYLAWREWRKNRRRRGALKAAGARTRALIASMTGKMRERARPRLVPQP